MRQNIGDTDQLVRVALGSVVILLGMMLESWWGALGLIPLLTGISSWCPAYALFGISTTERARRV